MFYTYLLKCIPTNEFYYGVRYSKKAHPSEFWKTYFTSSKSVTDRILLFGKDSFEFQIRRTFLCSKKARVWEDRVLRKLRVLNRTDFINKSYGLNFESRKTITNKKMIFLINEKIYKMVDLNLVPFLVERGIAIIKGKPKPKAFGKNLSKKLKGRKKDIEHLKNIKKSLTGKKYGKDNIRFGEKKAAEIANKRRNAQLKYLAHNDHHAKGKTYDQLYGVEKSNKIKNEKSSFLSKNNPSKNTKGKTYEEIYGEEKAKELKLKRAKTGKDNAKSYHVYKNDLLVFNGGREEVAKFISVTYTLPISNILYKKEILFKNNIIVKTQPKHR